MALKKEIILENGIPMNYHRISQINNIVNVGTQLIIFSYVNQEQRNREKNKEIRYSDEIYKITDAVLISYNDTLKIEDAYEYLKTTDKYKDAEDIFEETNMQDNDPIQNNDLNNDEELLEQNNMNTDDGVDENGKIDE